MLTKKDKIVSMIIKDVVKQIGRSGYVALPQELVGKYVEINVGVIRWIFTATNKKEK